MASPVENLDFVPLPDGHRAVAAILLVKTLDQDGLEGWSYRTTDGLTEEEMLGALVVRTEMAKQNLLAEFEEPDPEGD